MSFFNREPIRFEALDMSATSRPQSSSYSNSPIQTNSQVHFSSFLGNSSSTGRGEQDHLGHDWVTTQSQMLLNKLTSISQVKMALYLRKQGL
ncbi:hypothetical protein DPEC_G00324950 [Dallia pectoralis]|uniref:Uncharacterized protein n=1 Tax=Dallia pectoralis TaxID=75939 RepID=A0ACC2FB60_DALPE|nr:hypothetical protein DPEC_G00324950 [Dallia pectoralis]